jgi:hypothetical protein
MAKMKLGKLPTNEILGIVIGGVAANFLAQYLNKPESPAAAWNPKIKAALPLIAGVVIAMQKNTIVKGVGYGMIAKGAADSATAFIGAYDPSMDNYLGAYEDEYMGSPADQSILSLPADQSILSEVDEDFIGADEMYMMNAAEEEF